MCTETETPTRDEREDARFSCAARRNSGRGCRKEKEEPTSAKTNSVWFTGRAALPGPPPGSGAGAAPPGRARLRGEEPLPTAPLPPKLLQKPGSPDAFPPANSSQQPKTQPALAPLRSPPPQAGLQPSLPPRTGLAQRGLRARPGPRPTPHRRRRSPLLSPAPGRAPLPPPQPPATLPREPAAGRAQPASPRKSFQARKKIKEKKKRRRRRTRSPHNFTEEQENRLTATYSRFTPALGRFVSVSLPLSRPLPSR